MIPQSTHRQALALISGSATKVTVNGSSTSAIVPPTTASCQVIGFMSGSYVATCPGLRDCLMFDKDREIQR